MNKNNSQWHYPRTGTDTHAETYGLYSSVMSQNTGSVGSIGASASCNAVANRDADSWLQVRYRTHFKMK